MTEELVYDAKTKQLIKDTLYEHLYGPVKADYQKRLDTIIMANSTAHKNRQRRLLYKNDTYEMTDPGVVERPVNVTHPDIRPMMADYVDDLTRLNTEELPYVLGFINQVLNSSNSLKDYFAVFPESVHGPIQALADQCGCKTRHLEAESVARLRERNRIPIDLMKQRMVLNLLL